MTCLSFSTPLGCTDGNVTTGSSRSQETRQGGKKPSTCKRRAQGEERMVFGCVGIFNGRLLLFVRAELQSWITLNPEE